VTNELEIYRLEGNDDLLHAVGGSQGAALSPTLDGLTVTGVRVFAD
jgi:hypothetical protein